MKIELLPELDFLSDLYAQDSPNAAMFCEYPSSNSPSTPFKNVDRFIIHDPFPPPHPELMKVLGPHHLMCGWGASLPIASRLEPPSILLDHWDRVFSSMGCPPARPQWQPATTDPSAEQKYITMFPHESIRASAQVIAPDVNYRLHSKQIIEQIKCPQAAVLESIELPCMVKLSHGYAGLGNFLLRKPEDQASMEKQLKQHWPEAVLIVNSVIENICGDYGAQFYLRSDGSIVWLGLTEQRFDTNKRWCGGVYEHEQQTELLEPFSPFVSATADRLSADGYHGLVGIDILRNSNGEHFLVDVNPRLTGISPFLMAARIFARERNLMAGVYRASCRYAGTLEQLIDAAEAYSNDTVMVLSGYEEVTDSGEASTICHLSVSSNTTQNCQRIFDELLKN